MKKHIFTLLLVLFSCGLFAETNIYAPTLTSPLNGAVSITPTTLLNWGAVAGAWSYKVEVSTDSAFTSPIPITTTYTAATFSYLDFGTKYFWRVKAFGLTDSSAWSGIWSFTTTDIVVISTPVEGAANQFVRFKFTWVTIAGATGYEWEVDSSLSYTSPYYASGIVASATNTGQTSQLRFGQNYFLRVRAFHATDTSGWSLPRLITTIDTIDLARPNGNLDTLYVPDLDIRWKSIGATYYELALAFDAGMTNPVTHMVDSSVVYLSSTLVAYAHFPLEDLLFDTMYYYSVRAMNVFDTTEWMTPKSFLVIDKVELEKPANNALGVTTLPTFEWNAIEGVDSYLMQYDTDPTFGSPVELAFGIDTLTYAPNTELLPLTQYYWRVMAITTTDTSFAPAWTFTTTTPYSVEENAADLNAVSLYPNPSKGRMTVEIDAAKNSKVALSLTNILGQVVMVDEMLVKPGKNTANLNMDALTSGIYMLRIQNGSEVVTRKVILDK